MGVTQLKEEQSAGQLLWEREKRITDAIQLRVPDRVPVQLFLSYFPTRYTGITSDAAYYDAEKWQSANRQTILDFAPDSYWVQSALVSGLALEILGAQQIKWPGYGLPPNRGHQMIELEPMKGDEYDAFLADPSDFIVRTYLPRVWSAMVPLAELPSLRTLIGGTALASFVANLAAPELAAALNALREAGAAAASFQSATGAFADEMAKLGFPSYNSPKMFAAAPFDTISDHLRGMQGTMVDMYRRPEKLLQALEMLATDRIEAVKQAPAPAGDPGNKRVFIALHRGSDGFMSLRQFETFYWPTLKKVMLALVEMGWTPCPFFEGVWDARLEYLLDLPKGSVLCHFAQTDMAKAKAVLGGHLCIMRDVPASLLQAGTVREVEEYCQNAIDVCGKDGGFIMTATCVDEARPENLKAMVDFTKSYGRYA